jgi:hypothetical protein
MTQPTDDELDLLLGDLGELTEDDLVDLVEAWQREDEATRRRAWTKAKAEIERRRLHKSLEHARHAVARWMAAGRSDFHGIGGLLGLPAEQARLRTLAAPAVLDAVVALLAEPALDSDEYDTLSRPWSVLDDEPGDLASGDPAADEQAQRTSAWEDEAQSG